MNPNRPPHTISPLKWVPTAYFAMGLPFITINLISAFTFKDIGISDTQIAFWTSIIMLPWTFKFLWSPFLEIYRTRKFFLLSTQAFSGIMFIIIALFLQESFAFPLSIMGMLLIAFSGATHDIACDGIYMAELNKEQQAQYIGVQGAFYNVAKLIANGGLVALAGILAVYFGAQNDASFAENKIPNTYAWMTIYTIIGISMILLAIYHYKYLPSSQSTNHLNTTQISTILKELTTVIKSFFHKKHITYYIIFILSYRLAEGFIIKIAPLFLRAPKEEGGLGLSLTEVGTINGLFGSIAFVLGSLLAGAYVSRYGLKKTLFTLCCIFNLPFFAYTYLAIYQPTNIYLIGTCITLEYFGYGFGFIGLTLFMMQQIAPGKHQTSHYAFASGIMALAVTIPGLVSGYFSDTLGYKNFFTYVLLAAIPAFVLTYFIPFTYNDSKKK